MKKIAELKELNDLDDKALYKEVALLNKKLSDMQFKAAFRKLKNYREIPALRKRIARTWTILNERAYKKVMQKEIKEVR